MRLVSVKANKDYRIEIDETVGLHIPAEICHLFQSRDGRAHRRLNPSTRHKANPTRVAPKGAWNSRET